MTMPMITTVTTVATCAVTVGAVGAGVPKGVRGLRRISRLLDGFLGDGTPEHKPLPERITELSDSLDEVKDKLDQHVDRELPQLMMRGTEWAKQTHADVAELLTRVAKLEGYHDGSSGS
jgi:predicted PurR-regulated permease PerM